MFITHLLGIDHAGHTFYANHSEIERKIIETDEILEDIVKNLDNDTIFILYGDHGMTNDGNHGGGSDNELKTVLFGYSKGGFPMLHQTKKIKGILERKSFDDVKQLDIATIVSNILEIPIPFSSLGVFHPIFHMSDNMVELP